MAKNNKAKNSGGQPKGGTGKPPMPGMGGQSGKAPIVPKTQPPSKKSSGKPPAKKPNKNKPSNAANASAAAASQAAGTQVPATNAAVAQAAGASQAPPPTPPMNRAINFVRGIGIGKGLAIIAGIILLCVLSFYGYKALKNAYAENLPSPVFVDIGVQNTNPPPEKVSMLMTNTSHQPQPPMDAAPGNRGNMLSNSGIMIAGAVIQQNGQCCGHLPEKVEKVTQPVWPEGSTPSKTEKILECCENGAEKGTTIMVPKILPPHADTMYLTPKRWKVDPGVHAQWEEYVVVYNIGSLTVPKWVPAPRTSVGPPMEVVAYWFRSLRDQPIKIEFDCKPMP